MSVADPLPDDAAFRVQFPGPYQHHEVVVAGWRVPLLHAQLRPDDRVTLVLDGRFGLDLTTAEAERVVPFLANAIAVALGYEAHPSAHDVPPLTRNPHPKPQRVMSVAGFDADAA